MPAGTILAHKHTLYETYAGFFRALATESFSAVRDWLHPELERLIGSQCRRTGEAQFLRSLRMGLGSTSQRLRLGSSQAEGAGQIRTQLLNPRGDQAGSVRFILARDGWRIYAVEVWTAGRPPSRPSNVEVGRGSPSPSPREQRPVGTPVYPPPPQKARSSPKFGVPRALSSRWLSKVCASD